jgi:hypothetical protein
VRARYISSSSWPLIGQLYGEMFLLKRKDYFIKTTPLNEKRNNPTIIKTTLLLFSYKQREVELAKREAIGIDSYF